MKRVVLFLATNLAIVLVLSVSMRLLGLEPFLTDAGLNPGSLLVFAAVLGFGGAFISLALSKWTAKRMSGAVVIEQPRTPTEVWLIETVRRQAHAAGIGMPEVAVFDVPEVNAFATGMSRNNSLVAVSSGLLAGMNRDEAEAVLAHEVSHIANGDMVTLTLIQGVVNTFVIFLARVVGWVVDAALHKGSEQQGPGVAYMVTVVVCDILFGVLASIIVMHFSRRREFRADTGAATLLGSPQPMIAALRRLSGMDAGQLPQNVATAGINGRPAWMALFSSHPPIAQRIEALNRCQRAS